MSSTSTTAFVVAAYDALLVREAEGRYRVASADEVLRRARYLLSHRVRRGVRMNSPKAVKDFLRLNIGMLEHEMFTVVYLDAQHRLLAIKELFRGTISQTSVYPREIVKEALGLNAAAAILAHNHPSGDAGPSDADKALTRRVKDVLAMVDVTVLDHLVVTCDDIFSFAERGLL